MNTDKSAFDYLEQVHDRQTFIEFVEALIRDRKDPGEQESWQNDRIDHFLDSALAGMIAHEGRDTEFLREPSWKGFADFLYFGKVYE